MQVVRGPHGEFDMIRIRPDDWRAIKRERPPLHCLTCEGRCYAVDQPYWVTAPGGGRVLRVVQMFRHNPGAAKACREMGGEPETPAHAALKQTIARGIEAVGGRARFEVVHADRCRSDVVGTKGRGKPRRFGYEAQLAFLSKEDAEARQERYEAHVDRNTWLHTGDRRWPATVPCLKVDGADQSRVIDGITLYRNGDAVKAAPLPVEQAVGHQFCGDIYYVYDQAGTWGTFWSRDGDLPALVVNGQPVRRQRPRRERQGDGEVRVKRFCDRATANVRESDRAVLDAGFQTIGEFHQQHHQAHRLVNDFGVEGLSDRQRAALALAHEFPELKTAPPDRLARLGIRTTLRGM